MLAPSIRTNQLEQLVITRQNDKGKNKNNISCCNLDLNIQFMC
jgi:hypothetical protein